MTSSLLTVHLSEFLAVPFYDASDSRTFRVSDSRVNGFSRTVVSHSNTPWFAMVSREWPDM